MSAGQKKKETDITGPNVVTMDQNEFNKVCKRVHAMLLSRAEKARGKKEKKPTKKSAETHIETSKDVFVFVHLLELVENMTEEISDLRNIISQVAGDEDFEEEPKNVTKGWPEMFSTNKKRYVN
jgi:hypothetical protein